MAVWNHHCHHISVELWILLDYWHRRICRTFLDVCYVNVENQPKVLGFFFSFKKPLLLHHFFTTPNKRLGSTWREAGGLKEKEKAPVSPKPATASIKSESFEPPVIHQCTEHTLHPHFPVPRLGQEHLFCSKSPPGKRFSCMRHRPSTAKEGWLTTELCLLQQPVPHTSDIPVKQGNCQPMGRGAVSWGHTCNSGAQLWGNNSGSTGPGKKAA